MKIHFSRQRLAYFESEPVRCFQRKKSPFRKRFFEFEFHNVLSVPDPVTLGRRLDPERSPADGLSDFVISDQVLIEHH